jgi:DinB superfamily
VDFDTLYLELVDSTGMIRSLLGGITEQDARIKPSADAWSILETLCHLYDEERYDFRPRLDHILHRPQERWSPIDPTGWVAQHRYNEQDYREIRDRFFGERSKSLDWLKGLEHADWASSYDADSGKISAGDMFVSWVAHDNLALRQLIELRRTRLERLASPYSVEYAGEW